MKSTAADSAPEIQMVGDLQIDQDLNYLRRSWLLQKFGWILMLFVAIGALFGVFGRGVLASQVDKRGSLSIESDRFARNDAVTTLTITVAGDGLRGDRAALRFGNLDEVEVEMFLPEPIRMRGDGDDIVCEFAVDPGASALVIEAEFRPQRYGSRRIDIGVDRGEGEADSPIAVNQFVFP